MGNGIGINLSVGAGAFKVGAAPRLAITPGLSLHYRFESDWYIGVQDTLSILPPALGRDEVGFNNETSIQGGYMFGDRAVFGLGGSLSQYRMAACSLTLCGVVAGVAPGASARFDLYGPWLSNAVGIGIRASVAWYTGSSPVLPNDLALTLIGGPIVRLGN